MEAGEWEAGIHEYHRYAFYATDTDQLPEVYARVGKLFKAHGQHQEAAAEFEKGIAYRGMNALYYELQYEAGLMYFLSGAYGRGLPYLETAWREATADSLAYQAGVLAVMSHNQRYDWEKAIPLCQEVFAEDSILLNELVPLYTGYQQTKFKKRNTAMWLSLFLPGTGQWYGGKFWRGVISGLLILSMAALTVFAVIWGRYILAFFTPFSFFQRFYQGGARYADTLVQLHNRNLRTRQAKEINEKIINRLKDN